MRVTENAVAAEVLIHLAWEAQESLSARLDGVHVADITLCPRKAWYRRNGRPVSYSAQDKILFMAGSGHHQMIQDIAKVPGLMLADTEVPVRYIAAGVLIHGTVDLLIRDDLEEIIGEIKTTRASADKRVEETSHYIEQVASYCICCQTRHGRLYTLHLMGDYKANRTPILRCWDLEFSSEDLARWEREMVRRHALITAPTPPHPYEAYKWECGYCSYSEKNGGPCPGGGLRVPFFINDAVPKGIPLSVLD